jgi:UDP-N-acetylmuramoyl-tripeptide--D-alanyl-D-alanine ligase
MLELGTEHEAGHERVGRAAAAVVERLVVVGDGAAGIERGAREAGLPADRVERVGDRAKVLGLLVSTLAVGDVVLVKASRGIELDLLVDDLKAALEADR